VRRAGIHLAVIASYLAIALIHLRPLATSFTRTLPRGEQMDVLLHGWIINWTARQLLRAPWNLFNANLFFPHPGTLAYTEHMLPEALPVAPVWALTHDPVITYNTAFLLTFVLGGWGTFLLVRRLTGDPWAAWVAGAFACWFPAKRWSLAHINTISVHGVPFAMLALHRLLERPGLARALVAGVLVALASLVSAYYTVYLPLLLLAAVPLIVWADGRRLDARRLGWLAVAAVAAAAVALPLLVPYLGAWTAGGEPARSYDLQIAGAADVAEFFILDSVFWSRFLLPEALDPLTTPFFPGAVATLLALLALFARREAATGGVAKARDGASSPDAGVAKTRDGVSGADAGVAKPRDGAVRAQEAWRRALAFASRNGLRLLGYALAAIFALVLADHLVAHHRAVAALQPGPPLPLARLAITGGLALVLLAVAEGRSFPALPRAAGRRFMASPRLVRAYAAVTAFAFLIALGPRLKFFGYMGPVLPYHWIYYGVPGASALRAPYRAAILGQAFLAVLIGFGAAWLLDRRRRRPPVATTPKGWSRSAGELNDSWSSAAGGASITVAVLLVAVMVAESTGNPLPLRDLPQPSSEVYGWIAVQPGDFGVFEWPVSSLMDRTARGQWLSTLHWKRRVMGHNGRVPADIRELHQLSQDWPPSPRFLDLLRDQFPVRYVIVHLDAFDPEDRRRLTDEILPAISAWWAPERSFDSDLIFRVRNGGAGRNLERRFAGWMAEGELVVELAEPVPPEGGWRFGAELAGERLPSRDLAPGTTVIRVALPSGLTSPEPVWLRLSIDGPGGRTLAVESIRFATAGGLVYP
jgi:hypothetical protein